MPRRKTPPTLAGATHPATVISVEANDFQTKLRAVNEARGVDRPKLNANDSWIA